MSSPKAVALVLTRPLESPFGWRAESAAIPDLKWWYPDGMKMTMSFQKTIARASKFLAYVPIIGTVVGIWRIHQGLQEYRYFHAIHMHAFGDRSVYWIVRGAIEMVPVLGGSVCLITDIVMTAWKWNAASTITESSDVPIGSMCDRCNLL